MTHSSRTLWILSLLLLAPSPARTFDGGPGFASTSTSSGEETYYESSLSTSSVEASAFESASGALPQQLYVVDAGGRVEYRLLSADASGTEWELLLEVAERPHERVDAVYQLIVALALPEGFKPEGWRIAVHQGAEGNTVPFVYGGEKVHLKRDRALERSWLPQVGGASGLPDLGGTGYAWTLWTTVLRYDPNAGGTLQALGTLHYKAAAGAVAPDPDDARSAAYVITWIPDVGDTIPPYVLRLDVGAAEE